MKAASEQPAKDSTPVGVVSTLPGPRQAILLRSSASPAGSTAAASDRSGPFPLVASVVKQTEDQLHDLRLLHDSVEFSLGDSAKRIHMLEKELHAAKGKGLPSTFCLDVLFVSSCS